MGDETTVRDARPTAIPVHRTIVDLRPVHRRVITKPFFPD
jgi:hypothetical protein